MPQPSLMRMKATATSLNDAVVESVPLADIPTKLLRAGLRLTDLVWPMETPIEERVKKRQSAGQRAEDRASGKIGHFIREKDEVIALGISFVREVEDVTGRRFPVLALAAVCTHPNYRKQGLGRAIVLDAWKRLGPELQVSLFQTGVCEFYERMGARIIFNRIINTRDTHPPFWEPYAMIYPREANWPLGAIDVQGSGW